MAATAISGAPWRPAATASPANTTISAPGASPLAPSMKLTALLKVTIHSTVPSPPTMGPSGRITPGASGRASMRPTKTAKTAASRTSTASLALAPKSAMSSRAPNTPTPAASSSSPPIRPSIGEAPGPDSQANSSSPTATPAMIPTPPLVGVGRRCRPRARGASTGPIRATRPATAPEVASAAAPATMAAHSPVMASYFRLAQNRWMRWQASSRISFEVA